MTGGDSDALMLKLAKAQALAWGFNDAVAGHDPDPEYLRRADQGDPIALAYFRGYESGSPQTGVSDGNQ